MKRHMLIVFALSLLMFLPGCFPTDVVWLPDSSGFVYVNENHELVLYDVSSEKARVVATYEWLQPGGAHAGIRGDGQRFALAAIDCAAGDAQATLRLVIFERDGQEVASERLDWDLREAPDEAVCEGAWIDWSSDNRHLLISAGDHGVGVFDLKSKRWRQWPEVTLPLAAERLQTGVSPIVPDGSGFIALAPEDALDRTLVLVDWRGRRTAFRNLDAVEERLQQETGAAEGGVSDLRWTEKGNLRLAVDQTCIEIDPKQMLVAVVDDQKLAPYLALAKRHCATIIPFGERAAIQVRDKGEENLKTIEFVRIDRDEVLTLVEATEMGFFLRSPDAETMLVWFAADGPGTDSGRRYRILVVDATGEILAKLPHYVDK